MTRMICILAFFLSLHLVQGQEAISFFDQQQSSFTSFKTGARYLDSLTRMEKVVLEGNSSKVPFYHYINKRTEKPVYVILLHGLGGTKEYWVNPSMPYLDYTKNLTNLKDSLLALGFSLLIPDAKFHGERKYELNFRNPANLPPMISQDTADAAIFFTLLTSTIREVRMLMDYAEGETGQNSLDFNMIGYSMGGGISLLVNSVEDRMNSIVACVAPMTIPYSSAELLGWSGDILTKMKEVTAYYKAAKQLSPVLMLNGSKDPFVPEKDAKAFFDQMEAPDKEIKFFDSGHELPVIFSNDVIAWLLKHGSK